MKINRIKGEFGQLSGEEIFKPIIKWLYEAAKKPEPEAEEHGPDNFRLDAETPPQSPLPEEEANELCDGMYDYPNINRFLQSHTGFVK